MNTDGKQSVLVDRIIYTASLVSNPRDIDQHLDVLRRFTSRVDIAHDKLNPEDLKALEKVQADIEQYLINDEKLRLFTPDSLRIQIEQYESGNSGHRTLFLVWAICGIALGAGVLATFLFHGPGAQSFNIGSSMVSGLMGLGAALLFIRTLPAFRSYLRRAFKLICIGIVTIGVGFALTAADDVFGFLPSSLEDIVLPLPFIIMGLTMTWGIREYAQLVGVQSRLLSSKIVVILSILVVGMSVAAAVISLSAPSSSPSTARGRSEHARTAQVPSASQAQADPGQASPSSPPAEGEGEQTWVQGLLPVVGNVVSSFGVLCLLVFAVSAIAILPRIRKQVAELYRPPIQALQWAIYFTFADIVIRLVLTGQHLTTAYDIIQGLLLVTMVTLYLRAGYVFSKVSRY